MAIGYGERVTNFNPRSLTGATPLNKNGVASLAFQSTLPHGSDRNGYRLWRACNKFQSTLPHGSDYNACPTLDMQADFNPRSLTGATLSYYGGWLDVAFISIHAPSRERHYR